MEVDKRLAWLLLALLVAASMWVWPVLLLGGILAIVVVASLIDYYRPHEAVAETVSEHNPVTHVAEIKEKRKRQKQDELLSDIGNLPDFGDKDV